jgi:uncharacterized FAD-dependent dehydrogenase
MQKKVTLRVQPTNLGQDTIIRQLIAESEGIPISRVTGFYLLKQSLDARSRQVWINLVVHAFIDEPFHERPLIPIVYHDVRRSDNQIIVVGAGPAGLFAALHCLELGVKPIVLERGKDVRARRRDLALLNRTGEVNPESNYCFGEGGAGTYSDGKLYTRSTKRGNVDKVLQVLVHFGAEENILYEAHPHIGTNKLPQIITAMRERIIACGGEMHFEEKLTGFSITNEQITGVTTANGNTHRAKEVILATGHSARDIFQLLHQQKILIEPKPFALGVRIEHPQELIDSCQYHIPLTPNKHLERPDYLPPASYSLVHQVNDRAVFSFCMCPGGIIAPAATSPGELVVNGWSPSKRNNPYANSGMVVQVGLEDALKEMNAARIYKKSNDSVNEKLSSIPPSVSGGALALMYFQQMVERNAFNAGGGKMVAPAQRMVDFVNGKRSSDLPDCSYLPGIRSTKLDEVLPGFIANTLTEGFKAFGKKMQGRAGSAGYFTNEAVVVATESRTSSPVRIPRDPETLEHPQVKGLYPCGEGGGYAGGIVSAAMDGERVAAMAIARWGIDR